MPRILRVAGVDQVEASRSPGLEAPAEDLFVECAAIALSRIGTGLDIQGGGSDLIFPHHEFSAAHAECVTGERRSPGTPCTPG